MNPLFRLIVTLALAVVLGVSAVGCEREAEPPPPQQPEQPGQPPQQPEQPGQPPQR